VETNPCSALPTGDAGFLSREVRTVASQQPVVRRRRIGLQLRKLRERQGLTLEQVAALMDCSQSKISRIETGNSSVGVRDMRDLLKIYEVDDQTTSDLMETAREARHQERKRGWWHPFNNILSSTYVANENAASRIRVYENQLVPGLLQTEGYARALFHYPGFPDEEVSERLRVRMGRQSLLTRKDDPISFEVILDESVLSRPIGGSEVMCEQLRRIVEVGEMSNVTVRVFPFEFGAHAGMEGTFAILDFAATEGSVVYAENAAGGIFLDKERELDLYSGIFDRLQAAALSPEKSKELIAILAEEPRWNRP
jgi:transcriptional regulator with XRE-family HTH domain